MDLKLLITPLFAYAAIVGVVFIVQGWLLFPAASVPAAPVPGGGERLEIEAASGERLVGVHVPASAPQGERIVILGFGGNAWNADMMAAYLHDLYPAADVVTYHYRGYGPSEGRPGAAALVADAVLVHDAAKRRFPRSRIVPVGFSIGSGIAARLAAVRTVDGLVLVTPFDSLGRVAAGHYFWLPVRLLFRHEIDAAAAMRETDVPTAILAGARDGIIVPPRTEALRGAVPNLVFDRTLAGAGHNDIYERADFQDAMRSALARVLTAEASAPPAR